MAETVFFGDLLHLGAWVGDRDEAVARLVRAQNLLHAVEEILFVDVRLERATRFAGNDEERPGEIDFRFRVLDLRRIGGIEHVKPGKSRHMSVGEGQHFGAEA